MSLSDLAIRRPIFISMIVIFTLIIGLLALPKLGVDMFPEVNFPVVTINVPWPGAAAEEMETLVAKPIEEAVSPVNGVEKVRSFAYEGSLTTVVEFTLDT